MYVWNGELLFCWPGKSTLTGWNFIHLSFSPSSSSPITSLLLVFLSFSSCLSFSCVKISWRVSITRKISPLLWSLGTNLVPLPPPLLYLLYLDKIYLPYVCIWRLRLMRMRCGGRSGCKERERGVCVRLERRGSRSSSTTTGDFLQLFNFFHDSSRSSKEFISCLKKERRRKSQGQGHYPSPSYKKPTLTLVFLSWKGEILKGDVWKTLQLRVSLQVSDGDDGGGSALPLLLLLLLHPLSPSFLIISGTREMGWFPLFHHPLLYRWPMVGIDLGDIWYSLYSLIFRSEVGGETFGKESFWMVVHNDHAILGSLGVEVGEWSRNSRRWSRTV